MRVSVVIPCYNGSDFIGEAIRSVLDQTVTDLQVIVVDDGSTDDSARVVGAFGDERLVILHQSNEGVASARNRGIRESLSPLVAFLDQDDVWATDKLEVQLPLFDDPEVGAVGSRMTYLGPRGPMRATAGEIADDQHDRLAAARLMPFPPSSLVVRREVFDKIGMFDVDLVQRVGPIDDLDLISRVAREYQVRTHPTPLGYYRVHAGAGSFSRFRDMQQGTRFLQALYLEQSLTWDDWISRDGNADANRRKDNARFLYRHAGMNFGAGQRARGAVNLLRAGILDPQYVTSRLRRQTRS